MLVDIPPENTTTLKSDSRGRVNFGTKLANRSLELAILGVGE